MGNFTSLDSQDMGDFDFDEDDAESLTDFQELSFEDLNPGHLQSTLERVVSGIIGVYRPQTQSTNKMPTIRKKPDLSNFVKSPLYADIKLNSGLKPDGEVTAADLPLHKKLMQRENGIASRFSRSFPKNEQRRIANMYIPNRKSQKLMSLESKVFISKLNNDGSRLITASQDNIIRVFDASKGTYHRINRIPAQDTSWCILDIDFSPCGKYFVYSTWSHYFIVVPLHANGEEFKWFHLTIDNNRSCVFSVRFSACGSYILGGSNDSCIHIADRNTSQIKRFRTDNDHRDINAVSYVDESPNIFVSATDDGLIKLWDDRCLGARPKPVGMFVGHFDGVTYIDSRNDGRHILSNSKDQSIKIWDLRKMVAKEKFAKIRSTLAYSWDYRWDNVPREFYNPPRQMEGDTSIMTYRGHRVTKSLIRAKFSPLEQTGQRYIYTGCGTGRVIIYDVLTGHIKEAIEGHKDIVRDVSWHPVRSEIVSSSWDSHVNLNRFKRRDVPKRSSSTPFEDERPLRRSRRIALRRQGQDDGGDE